MPHILVPSLYESIWCEKRWAKSFTVLVPTFWRLAKLSPLLPFHDGHKVLCLDICIGNIIRLYRSNILPRNKGWTAKIRTSYQFNFPAKLLQFMIHYFFKLWLHFFTNMSRIIIRLTCILFNLYSFKISWCQLVLLIRFL